MLVMTFNQIKIFLTVAEQMNFTNASEELFLSQSSVSKQIRKLEVELDTTLFIRKKTGTPSLRCIILSDMFAAPLLVNRV